MVLRQKLGGLGKNERGFTLPEVMITIVLIGIVMAIASSTWFGVVESRRVDSAADQLASDLRLAHSRATNQLVAWEVRISSDSSTTYQLVKLSSPEVVADRSLPDGTQVVSATTVRFTPDGTASVVSGAGSPITVRASNNTSKSQTVQFNTATSRIRVGA